MIFDAPCCEGDGADLPLILGLRSMSEKQGVLEMDPKRKRLTLPRQQSVQLAVASHQHCRRLRDNGKPVARA